MKTETRQSHPPTYYAERDGDGANRRDWDTYVCKSGEGRTCTMDVLIGETRRNTMWERANDIAQALNERPRLLAERDRLRLACEHAAQSEHHPHCISRRKRYRCSCHVEKARAALASLEG